MFVWERIFLLLSNLVLVWTLLTCSTLFGVLILRKLLHTNTSKLFKNALLLITALVLGFIPVSYYYLLIGVLGQYNVFFIVFVPLVLALLAALSVFKGFSARLSVSRGVVLWSTGYILTVVLLAFPDVGFDSNWFHLSQPQYYLMAGKLYHVGGYIFPSGYPKFVEMLLIPQLKLGDSLTTSVFFTTIYFLLGTALYAIAREFKLTRVFAGLLALAVVTVPVIFSYANLAYVDNFQALAYLLAFYWLIRAQKSYLVAGLLLIPVCVAKYSGAFLCIPLAFYAVLHSGTTVRTKGKNLALLAVPAILGMLPWLVLNRIQVGNYFDPLGRIGMYHYGSTAKTYLEYFALIDWEKTLVALKTTPRGYLTPVLVVCGLVYGTVKKQADEVFFILSALIIWRLLPPGTDFRYFVPFIPICAFLGVRALQNSAPQKARSIVAVVLFGAIFVQAVTALGYIKEHAVYAFGAKGQADYKNVYFAQEPFIFYDPSNQVQQIVGTQKLLISGADLIYPTLTEFNVYDYSFASINRTEIYSFNTLNTQMKKAGFEYFLTNRGTLQEFFSTWFVEHQFDLVSDNFKIMARGDTWYLYKVK